MVCRVDYDQPDWWCTRPRDLPSHNNPGTGRHPGTKIYWLLLPDCEEKTSDGGGSVALHFGDFGCPQLVERCTV